MILFYNKLDLNYLHPYTHMLISMCVCIHMVCLGFPAMMLRTGMVP